MSSIHAFRLLKSIYRARRKGLLHLQKADGPVSLKCIGGACGLCCEILGDGIKVTGPESSAIPQEGLYHCNQSFFLKSYGSVCVFLKSKSCSIYPNRPRGCAEYPWYNINGALYFDAGCPGMDKNTDQKPPAESIRDFSYYISGLPPCIQKIIRRWILCP